VRGSAWKFERVPSTKEVRKRKRKTDPLKAKSGETLDKFFSSGTQRDTKQKKENHGTILKDLKGRSDPS